ncbi:MAG: hypothetical protein GY811_27610 [Myxococcales bacterium]|nr:hypothetical protein [Myxococcales bacterium]
MRPLIRGLRRLAGEGGYVFEIRGVPTWDTNTHLDGQMKRSGLAVRNPVRGEQEGAIPAHVPPSHIKRYGQVVEQKFTGRLYVKKWIDNPGFVENGAKPN